MWEDVSRSEASVAMVRGEVAQRQWAHNNPKRRRKAAKSPRKSDARGSMVSQPVLDNLQSMKAEEGTCNDAWCMGKLLL